MAELPTSSEAAAPPHLAASWHPTSRRSSGRRPRHPLARDAPASVDASLTDHRGVDYPSLQELVAMARHGVEGCDLASAVLISDGVVVAAAASEPPPSNLDKLQHRLGEGPGLQACRTSSIVSTDDLTTDARWPTFTPHTRGCGIAAVVSVPLIPARRFPWWSGWLTLYCHDPGPFPSASIALAETLGLYFSSAVNSELHAEGLQAALASRDLIGQAKGIIMARRDIDDAAAFAELRRASQHTNRPLREIAEAVVRSCGRHGIDERPTH